VFVKMFSSALSGVLLFILQTEDNIYSKMI
jgi:hypothetical protein